MNAHVWQYVQESDRLRREVAMGHALWRTVSNEGLHHQQQHQLALSQRKRTQGQGQAGRRAISGSRSASMLSTPSR
jgi:hypothetical protein